ncbi:hypothetical protein [Synechococcus sp. CC9605]|uniref:hypothetical protein n=1 Tax=Synechococcus sp. (strain CC9605) TaxID=110662 RepID=UPI00215363D2|nr:hypothetical protein [Synechococcus sp. CC9605]
MARARKRALGGVQKVDATASARPAGSSPTTVSGETVRLQTGETVPVEFYDLAPTDQRRMLEIVRGQETKKADGNAALTAVNTLLDLRAQDNKRVRSLEAQLSTALAVIEAMQKRMDSMDLQVQADKSTALLEQEAGIAAAVTGLSAIRAEAGQEAAQHQAEREAAAVEHRQQLEAQAVAIEALQGSVKSTTELMGERSNAVVAAVADAEGRQARLGVQLQELEGKTNAWTDPITRSEVTAMATDLVWWPSNGVIRCRRLLMRCWRSWPINSLRGSAPRELTQYVRGNFDLTRPISPIALREGLPDDGRRAAGGAGSGQGSAAGDDLGLLERGCERRHGQLQPPADQGRTAPDRAE